MEGETLLDMESAWVAHSQPKHPVEETTAHCTISWPYQRGRHLDTVYRACHLVVSYYCLILLVISAKSPAI